MPPSMNIKSSESARLSTMGIVLISIAGVVLVIALSAIAVLVVRRRRPTTTSSDSESRLRSVWILCRRRRRNRNINSNSNSQHHSNTKQTQPKHLRKLSTATNASSLEDCRVAMPAPPAKTRVPQQWFLQGSPQQEISDPYDDEMDLGSPIHGGGDGDWSPIHLKEYSHGHGYGGESASPFSQPKQTLRYQDASAWQQGSATTTLVQGGGAGPSPVRSTFEIESLAPSHQYPFAPSEPNSPMYGRFLRPELVQEQGSLSAEHDYNYEYDDSPGDSRRNTFGYPATTTTTTTTVDRIPSPSSSSNHSSVSPPAPAATVSPARQVQVRYQQEQQQDRREPNISPTTNRPIRPSVHAMHRQQSDAPSFALSIPRSVSFSDGQDEEMLESFPTSHLRRPARPSLKRDQTLRVPAPQISITAPSESVAVPVTAQEEEEEEEAPSYFTRRVMPPPQPSSATSPATSPGLDTAFRSAFFLDAGPQRGVAMSSMPQTPAVDE